MTVYKTVEFEHWYELEKILNNEQPTNWTIITMPSSGLTGGTGKVVLELPPA